MAKSFTKMAGLPKQVFLNLLQSDTYKTDYPCFKET